jgi:hypothetical protein
MIHLPIRSYGSDYSKRVSAIRKNAIRTVFDSILHEFWERAEKEEKKEQKRERRAEKRRKKGTENGEGTSVIKGHVYRQGGKVPCETPASPWPGL